MEIKEKNPDVSIIVLTYNQENYVLKTLESIINQKTRFSYEIIISDDCSCDKTPFIIEEFRNKYLDKVVSIIRKKNLGIPKNYYETLKFCKGKYIMGCAGDDYWLDGKIESQVSYMEDNPSCSVYYGQIIMYFNKKKELGKEPTKETTTTLCELLSGNGVNAVAACTRKSKIDEYIREVNPQEKDWMMEDYPMWLWMAKKGRIDVSMEPYAVYRQIQGSISHPDNLKNNLKFTVNTYRIAKYFADTKKEKRIAWEAFAYAIAENYWLFGDMEGYRRCYRNRLYKLGKRRDFVKYSISYIPFIGKILNHYYLSKR